MKQWVVGLTALALLCAAGSVGAMRYQDEAKKDKVEEGPKPKVEANDAVVTPASWPCPPAYNAAPAYHHGCAPAAPAVSYSYQYVTQYQARSRTVCEYVPVTTTVDVEEVTCVPVKKMVDVEETTWESKTLKKKGKRSVYKPVERKEKVKVGEYKWVTKDVEQQFCEVVPVQKKGVSKYTEMVAVKRKDKVEYTECVPVDRKEVRHAEYCQAFTRKEERTACTTVNQAVPVTRFATQIVPAPQSPCPPDPCAPMAAPQQPQVVCVPYTTYECRPTTVMSKYQVDVVDYRMVKQPYEVTIREYKPVKKSVDVEVCEYKPVEKSQEYTYTEYTEKRYTKKVPVRTCELVWTDKEVTVCDYKAIEEDYDYEEVIVEPKTTKKKVEVTEYKWDRKIVKRPSTSYQMRSRVICETVPVQVLVPVQNPCPSPAPAPMFHSAPSQGGGAVIPGPTCY